MSDPDKSSDIEKLLAEVDRSLGASPAQRPSGAADAKPAGEARTSRFASTRAGARARFRFALTAATVAAGGVFLLFAMLPYLGAFSGAAGAFVATFVSLFVFRRR